MTVQQLREYLTHLPSGVVVTGHPAPDTDAVISALFEAYRLTVAGTPAAPLVQDFLPRETAWLLGELASLVPVGTVPADTPLTLTDHHDVARYSAPVVAVVDHHPLAPDTDLTGIDARVCPVGAATTLVAQRLRQDGLTPDRVCARILLGAILLDTEGLSPYKAKDEDRKTAQWLGSLCGENAEDLFADLRRQLLAETDVTTLYRRDYRTYTDPDGRPLLGFAILKVWADACPDLEAVRRLLAADEAPTRVAKIVLHHPTDDTRTEYYLAAGQWAELVLEAVAVAAGESARRESADTVFLPENARHWGRKRYAGPLTALLQQKS